MQLPYDQCACNRDFGRGIHGKVLEHDCNHRSLYISLASERDLNWIIAPSLEGL